MSEEAPQPPAIDARRLIADIRRGDPKALEQALDVTFRNDLGRLVLARFLIACGVGTPIGGAGVSDADLRYAVGRHDAALELADLAGFDAASIVTSLATDNLEGDIDDEAYAHRLQDHEPID